MGSGVAPVVQQTTFSMQNGMTPVGQPYVFGSTPNTANPNLNATSPSNINITNPTTATPNVYQPNYGTLGANTGSSSGLAGIITNSVSYTHLTLPTKRIV